MRWEGRRESENVEDRRGLGGPMIVGGGLTTLVIVLIAAFLGVDPRPLIQQVNQVNQQAGPAPRGAAPANPAEDTLKRFVGVVLADTEDVWSELFRTKLRQNYKKPKLVLFQGQVQSACGFASAASGPFYCPGDEQVYLDLEFCRELRDRFKAPGEFAIAYVIAHEIGHHVQHQLGFTKLAHRRTADKRESNRLSVRLELQADFLAGVWAHHAERMKKILERGDVDNALRAAEAVGDDRIQKQSQGYIVPDAFTHGSSAQRRKWFLLGIQTGDLSRMKDLFDLPDDQL